MRGSPHMLKFLPYDSIGGSRLKGCTALFHRLKAATLPIRPNPQQRHQRKNHHFGHLRQKFPGSSHDGQLCEGFSMRQAGELAVDPCRSNWKLNKHVASEFSPAFQNSTAKGNLQTQRIVHLSVAEEELFSANCFSLFQWLSVWGKVQQVDETLHESLVLWRLAPAQSLSKFLYQPANAWWLRRCPLDGAEKMMELLQFSNVV